jgi:hypothetical protein
VFFFRKHGSSQGPAARKPSTPLEDTDFVALSSLHPRNLPRRAKQAKHLSVQWKSVMLLGLEDRIWFDDY